MPQATHTARAASLNNYTRSFTRDVAEKIEQATKHRAKRMGRNPWNVVQQAHASRFDFFHAYGDIQADLEKIKQADYTTGTTGLLNRVFGRQTWAQLNVDAPTWDALPFLQLGPNTSLGWRAKTAFASNGTAGQSEGNIPNAITSSFQEVSPTPTESSTQMRVSGLHQDMADIDDVALGAISDVQSDVTQEHSKQIERALHGDIDTTAGNDIESVDRLTASSSNQGTVGWTAGDEDIFGIDRSANTWADAQQDAAASNRALTTELIDQNLLRAVQEEGADPTFWVTGFDTATDIDHLYDDRARIDMEVSDLTPGETVNDAEARDGMHVSTIIGKLHGRPIIQSDQVNQDGSSRLYLLDTTNPAGRDKPRAGIDIIRPTEVFIAGERSNNMPQAIDFLGDSVLATTRAQLGSRALHKQGQLRDLS